MGGVSWRGGSREVVKLTVTARLKMEDACIFCDVIETFWQIKMTKTKRWEPFEVPNGIGTIVYLHIGLFVQTTKYFNY